MSDARWTPADMPDLTGVTAVVTGANSGLGFWTSLELARHGATVVLACRDLLRGDEALGQIRIQVPQARIEVRALDLAALASVRAFAESFAASYERLDVLVNNAGVMAIPRRLSADGFEMQLATNHLGHFALTGLLLPKLLAGGLLGAAPRVVTVSSMVHRIGKLHRDDLMLQHAYSPYRAYSQSKLANLLFMRELQRRAEDATVRLVSLGAHPGYAATNLQGVGPRMSGNTLAEKLNVWGNKLVAQTAEQGAWPSLRAASDPLARGGEYFGPGGFGGQRGNPRRVSMSTGAMDPDDAGWLWRRSVELTEVDYPQLSGPVTR